MDFQPTLSPRFVVYLRNYLMDQAVDAESIFQSCGLPASFDQEYLIPIPVSTVAKLFEVTAAHTRDQFVGLNMGKQFHYESSSIIILGMLAAPSVDVGIKLLCRYDRYIDTGIEAWLEAGVETAKFTANLVDPTHSRTNQLNEYLMSFIAQTLTMATRRQMPIREVWFRHSEGSNIEPLKKFFKAPLKYSQTDNRLFFDSTFLQEKFFTTNNLLYEMVTNTLKTYFFTKGDQSNFIAAVCREIIRQTQEGAPGINEVASSLAMSSRTLQRRLDKEGYSFQMVKKLAREQRAKYYLRGTNMSLAEISFELGYSEASAFSRAFLGWTGMTPQFYRKKAQQLLST